MYRWESKNRFSHYVKEGHFFPQIFPKVSEHGERADVGRTIQWKVSEKRKWNSTKFIFIPIPAASLCSPMSPNLASSGHTCSFFVLFPREIRILSYFLLSQAGLLSHPLDFQHLGVACSWAFRGCCLKSDQHWWTSVPSKVFSQATLLTSFLISLKSALLT